MSKQVVCSQHSKERIKERVGLKEKSADRLVNKIYLEGIDISKATGALKCYLMNIAEKNNTRSTVRVYGRYVYIFDNKNRVLITTYELPKRFHTLADKLRGKKIKNNNRTIEEEDYNETDRRCF